MKTIRLGGLEWSKVICGSNPFNARSHFSSNQQSRNQDFFANPTI